MDSAISSDLVVIEMSFQRHREAMISRATCAMRRRNLCCSSYYGFRAVRGTAGQRHDSHKLVFPSQMMAANGLHHKTGSDHIGYLHSMHMALRIEVRNSFDSLKKSSETWVNDSISLLNVYFLFLLVLFEVQKFVGY